MGVSGCGKTTYGAWTAAQLQVPFIDADAFHPPENLAKMAAGNALTDTDRAPWLATLQLQLTAAPQSGLVLACSALKAAYRRSLAAGSAVQFVYLQVSADQARQRLMARESHFMPASLIDSQFAALEPPADAWVINVDQTEDQVKAELGRWFGLR